MLYTIDGDLEEGLALWERDGAAELAATRALYARALRGAAAADEAFDTALFGDYAASFAGWSVAQRHSFRHAQEIYGRAREALAEGDHAAVLAHSRHCIEIAEPLGDWWGTAMALTGEGLALEALGDLEGALVAHARARLLHRELRLPGSEYRNLRALARVLTELDRRPRARLTLARALELAERFGDADGRIELLRQRVAVEESEGDLQAAKQALQELQRALDERLRDGQPK